MSAAVHLLDLLGFLDAAQASACFEDVAQLIIERALALTASAIESSEYAGHAQLLRGVLHLRPQGPYQGLALGLADPHAPASLAEEIVSSATLWHWVTRHQVALALDVELGLVAPVGAPLQQAWSIDSADSQQLLGSASMQALLGSGATHVLVSPLVGLRGELVGMLSMEARCRRSLGRPFVWAQLQDALALLGRVGVPYLLARPARQEASWREPDPLLPVVGPSMLGVIKLLSLFARQHETILLMGPTGAGKSRMAKWCHARSARHGGPFEVLDLLSIPEPMQLAHLVGWRRGAFTGAERDHDGALARARGGTLFIDEIDKLSMETQAGLLRLLEERRYRPLGAAQAHELEADVRFIVGTNIALREAVEQGRFREDLYYRVNVLPTRLPSLDERHDELGAWADFMAQRAAAALQLQAQLGPDVVSALCAVSWPGNLRQLDNVMRRACVIALSQSLVPGPLLTINAEHIASALQIEGSGPSAPPSAASSAAASPSSALSTRPDASPRQADPSLLDALAQAAEAFLAQIERSPLDLEHADAFKGVLLHYAQRRHGGDLDAAFCALGRQVWVQQRNHHRVFRREAERVERLLDALGQRELPPAS